MLIVRGTKKVLDRLGSRTVRAADDDHSTARLGDWYVNVPFWKPPVALFVSETTLLPVLMPFAATATLLERFPSSLLTHRQAHEAPRTFSDAELTQMDRTAWPRPPAAACSA